MKNSGELFGQSNVTRMPEGRPITNPSPFTEGKTGAGLLKAAGHQRQTWAPAQGPPPQPTCLSPPGLILCAAGGKLGATAECWVAGQPQPSPGSISVCRAQAGPGFRGRETRRSRRHSSPSHHPPRAKRPPGPAVPASDVPLLLSCG